MKKVLFLMSLLFLMVLGTASLRAQVRIGGDGAPNAAAVLDLNADNSATPTANKGALALPRVSLANNTAQLNGATPITGMLVYNTNATLGTGIYFWDGSKWVIISGDGVVGNELTDTIAGGGLNKTGGGTAASPYKVGIKTGGVTTGMIANGAVTSEKISTAGAAVGSILMSDGSTSFWSPAIGQSDSDGSSTVTPYSEVVTWTKIASIVTHARIPFMGAAVVPATGVRLGDLCLNRQNHAITVVALNDAIILSFVQKYAPTDGWVLEEWVRCYRPSA